jgi:Arc/MetJ-type ribon-helix-helix transcriptional regulator
VLPRAQSPEHTAVETDLSAALVVASDFGSQPSTTSNHLTVVRESKVTVKIPRPLYRKIQQVVEDSGFNSPTDFIVYVLRDLMGEADAAAISEFNQEELDDVKRKLKNLGYL